MAKMQGEELKEQFTKQIRSIARYALLEYDRNLDERAAVFGKDYQGVCYAN